MNALHLSYHCCGRVIKIATLVQNHQIANCFFMQHKLSHRGFLNQAPWLSFYPEDDEGLGLRNKLAGLRQYGIDLVHVHNEPSWLVRAVKKVWPDMPTIFDAHDLSIVEPESEWGDPAEWDLDALQCADGIVYTSETHKKLCERVVPRAAKVPNKIIYSKVLEAAFPELDLFERIPGIVFQGGIWDGKDEEGHTPFPYRNWLAAFKYLQKRDIPVNLFPASLDSAEAYVEAGINVYPNQEYGSLMAHLTRFDWGLVGSPVDHEMIRHCMPNKLFEYVAAGIPVICTVNAVNAAKWVQKNKVGVVVNSIKDIHSIYHLHEEYRKRIRDKRFDYAMMEGQEGNLRALYNEVLARRK